MPRRQASLLTEILPPEERAVETVVARYQRVAPAVTRFARSLSGDDHLRLRLGSQASASPGEIVLDPGLFQAAYARQAPVTPTEVALASALHEVVHLVATGFEERRPVPPGWFPDGAEPPPEDPGAPPRRPLPGRRRARRGHVPRRRGRPPGGPGHGRLPGGPLGARRPVHQRHSRGPGALPSHGPVRPGLLPGRRRLPGSGGPPGTNHPAGGGRPGRRRSRPRRRRCRPRALGSRLRRPRTAGRGPLPRPPHRGLPGRGSGAASGPPGRREPGDQLRGRRGAPDHPDPEGPGGL